MFILGHWDLFCALARNGVNILVNVLHTMAVICVSLLLSVTFVYTC